MSGDVQPRKRKDKKKRKDDGDQIPEKLHVPLLTNNNLNNEDVNIHLHKDEGTGGGICAKFVFFILFSALTVLIGLIITEYRGLTDLETTDPNSKFSQLFEGWVDSNNHDDHDEHVLDAIDVDHDENHGEDHNDISYEEDRGDDVDEEGNEDNSDEDDHDDEELVDARNSEEQDENDEELEPIDDSYEDEEPEEEDREEIDDEEEDDEDIDSVEEAKEFVASEEDDIEQDEDEPDDNQNEDYKHKELDDNEQKDFNENDEDDDEDIEQDYEDQEDEDQKYEDQEDEQLKNEKVSTENRLVSEEKLADDKDIENKEGDLDLHQEEELNEDITSDKDSKEKSQNNNDVDNDNIDEKKEENIQLKSKTKETVEQDQEKIENGSVESSGMAVKIGVGLALLVVAHLVLVKKWRNAGDDTLPFDKPPPVIQDRRNTIIVPRAFKEVEPDMEQVQEDFSDEDEGEGDDENNMEERSDVNSTKAKYEELATAYTRPVLQSNLNNEDIHGDYEYDDEEDEQYEEEIEEEEASEEEEEEEYDNEEAEDVDDEDEELLQRLEARYGKLQKDNDTKSTENRDFDFAQRLEVNEYEYTNITNDDDYNIKDDLDEAQNSVENDTSHAIVLFDKILQKFPFSPRSLFGKALALDILADKKRSNDILKKSLHIYVQLLQTKKVPPALYQLAAERCINRMRFIGQYKNTIAIHKLIINRFPNDPKHLNNLVVTYLTINRIEDAKSILKQILRKWPENGFALVHYGFILKTWDNDLEKAVLYLKRGISTKEEGVIDGRFYFHLGDALVRLGKPEEAAEIYEEGRINKLFLSKNQRSLYNVPHLSAKPWWNSKDVPSYSKSLDLLAASWKQIRKEGLSILNEKGYFKDESENLKHTGEWKQFELYTRGQKNIENCKICPITCSIIYQIPEARTCKRGQTKFSVMHPGTHIWPHCGPTNCRLRVHLGLKIPSNTFIRVADDVKSWKEGEVLIFDDSFEHEVWHNGTDFRLILIMDIWHPELTLSEINSLSPI